jgi:hypothetical protein
MTLVASSLWSLDHLCSAMPSVIREWPELREIRVAMGAMTLLDEASAASVISAIRIAARAGVEIRLDGCDARMAEFLLARGVDTQHLGTRREATADSSETLH